MLAGHAPRPCTRRPSLDPSPDGSASRRHARRDLVLKRGRPCIVRHDGCERATGDLSSSTTRSSGPAGGPSGSPPRAAAGGVPEAGGERQSGWDTLPGAGHAGAQPPGRRGGEGPPGQGQPPSAVGALCRLGCGDRQSHSSCSKRGFMPSLPVQTPSARGPSGKLSQDGLDVGSWGRRRGRHRSLAEPMHSRTLEGAGLRVAGGTENRPSVLYSALIKRTHHRQPLLKYP